MLTPPGGEKPEAAEDDPAGQVVPGGLEVAEAGFEVRTGRVGVALDECGTAQVVTQVGVEGLAVRRLDTAPDGARFFEQCLRLIQPPLARAHLR